MPRPHRPQASGQEVKIMVMSRPTMARRSALFHHQNAPKSRRHRTRRQMSWIGARLPPVIVVAMLAPLAILAPLAAVRADPQPDACRDLLQQVESAPAGPLL